MLAGTSNHRYYELTRRDDVGVKLEKHDPFNESSNCSPDATVSLIEKSPVSDNDILTFHQS